MNYKQQHIDVLLLACKKQDQKAQMELYQRFYNNTYHAAFRILKNSNDAMDAMPEAIITAFQRLDQYSGEGMITGSGDLQLKGDAARTEYTVTGSGSIETDDLKSQRG